MSPGPLRQDLRSATPSELPIFDNRDFSQRSGIREKFRVLAPRAEHAVSSSWHHAESPPWREEIKLAPQVFGAFVVPRQFQPYSYFPAVKLTFQVSSFDPSIGP